MKSGSSLSKSIYWQQFPEKVVVEGLEDDKEQLLKAAPQETFIGRCQSTWCALQ
jgi:hypothetical protein